MEKTGLFTIKMNTFFDADAGAYTTFTDKEVDKGTYNVKSSIRNLMVHRLGRENIPVVNVTEKQSIDFKICPKVSGESDQVQSIPCKFSKKDKDEMTIYFSNEFLNMSHVGAGDIWYIYFVEDSSMPIVGVMTTEKWEKLFDENSEEVSFESLMEEHLGIENTSEECEDEETSNEQPFDADKIRIEQQMLSVKYLYELHESGLLETNPNFQRKPVWKENKRKSLLIESLMLRIPIPAFYFYENEDSQFQVIDGQQRLLTIFEFLRGEFKLTGLEYLGDTCDKRKFEQLDVKYQQRIFRTQLAVNVLDARSPHKVIYDIFRRINTGGINLTLQEMRNAICSQPIRDFLKMGVETKEYQEATRYKINDIRMDSQELFLRFVALYRLYDFEKEKLKPYYASKLSTLLDETILEMATLSKDELEKIYLAFKRSMRNCKELFGKYAFVKISLGDTGEIVVKKDLINKSLFMAFSVILSNEKYEEMNLKNYSQKALLELADRLAEKNYEMAISGATGDRRNVMANFEYSQEVINKCINH